MNGEGDAPRRYTIAVRELCEFAAKAGDLDIRFTPSPTADEGMAGHKIVASRRGESRRPEVKLSASWRELVVRGRADGFDEGSATVEEVKTYKGPLDQMPANRRALHWAQAKVYGSLLCQQFGLPRLHVHLVYFDVDSQEETVLPLTCSAEELLSFFEGLCGRFLAWAQQELEHRSRRDGALASLRFPYPDFKPGQRSLADDSFRAVRRGRWLMAQAGTGLGKTTGTIFPLLKAMPGERLDKVFFLTAKTSGQRAPLESLSLLAVSGLRVLQLVARDRACDRPGRACQGGSCDLARGFYDRLADARKDAVDRGDFSVASVQLVAQRHHVCRYYLAQELVRWADVIVADYNYQFDSSALLNSLVLVNEWRVAMLVDEAHNLVERAREMYSVRLSRNDISAAAKLAPERVRDALRRLLRAWKRVVNVRTAAYVALDKVPDSLLNSAGKACGAIDEMLSQDPGSVPESLLDVYFRLLQFQQLAESLDTHSFCAIERSTHGESFIGVRNVVPAPYLKRRLQAAHAGVMFSATLAPFKFYSDMLGLPKNTAVLEVASAFHPAQLEVSVVRGVSTRFAARERSLVPIADVMAEHYARRPGNYMAFFSSFDYLERVLETFSHRHPAVPTWRQDRSMSERQRADFMDRFTLDGSGIGFAVLGGSFSEGVDLPGRRLIGAFIATLGLPQVNPANEEMRLRMENMFARGYDYTYLFPGLRKVVQAAGRVIRTETDQGVVVLIDDRYRRDEVRNLLPTWWEVRDTTVSMHDRGSPAEAAAVATL